MVAGGRDGAGGAQLETPRAAADARALVGAEGFVEVDVAWFVELADEVRRLQDGARDGGGVARVGAEIPVEQVVRREQRQATGEVEDQVAPRSRAVARRPEDEFFAR